MGALSSQIQALITYANETTGKEDTRMGDAVQSLIDGYGSGSSEVDENADVLFIDYDGTPIAGYTLAEAKALTALPTPPTHEGLVFEEWNWTLEEVRALTMRMTIGALYDTTDGLSRFRVELDSKTGLTVSLKLYDITGAIKTIWWGDDTSSSAATNSSTAVSHTYESAGAYTISTDATGLNRITDINSIKSINIGSDMTAFWYGNGYHFYNNKALETITLHKDISLSGSMFQCLFMNDYSLKAVVLPRTHTCIGHQEFACITMNGLSISLPPTLSTITGDQQFQSTNLKRLELPTDNITATTGSCKYFLQSGRVQDGNFCCPINFTSFNNNFGPEYCYKFEVYSTGVTTANFSPVPSKYCKYARLNFPNLTAISSSFFYAYYMETLILITDAVPTISNASYISGIVPNGKLYVPDALVDSYKTADIWSTYADYIYPLSEYQG